MLPPMKYKVGDKIWFKNGYGELLYGEIVTADFGGAWEFDFHSYDILVEDQMMVYKHIEERDCWDDHSA